MRPQKNALRIFFFGTLFMFITPNIYTQTKQLKRPKNTTGINSVDQFVKGSFNLYDKVYKYDGYIKTKTPLDDSDFDVLEDALDDLTGLSDSAPDIIDDISGASVLKQAKATLQINKAKKALKYSIKTAKELLVGNKKDDEEAGDSDDNDSIKEEESNNNLGTSNGNVTNEVDNSNMSDNLEVYSKFDYVPGDKLIFFDDFSQDFIGDFPSKWNTNGSGEVVKTNKAEGNWFEFKPGYKLIYIPLVKEPLPEEYTIEFDLLVEGLSKKTSSTAMLHITLDDNDTFGTGKNFVYAGIPFGQYGAFGIKVRNAINNKPTINSNVTADIRDEVLNRPHISIAVNKKRFRLWINQVKYVDIPQMVPEGKIITNLKFNLSSSFKDGQEHLFIQNLKIAEGGLDLRKKLMTEGRVSTNGILFDSGSANIQPQSLGIIRQISQVLIQDKSIKLNIIGHTDDDGNDTANMKLSKDRANAVKEALINIYKISKNRLQTDGKGEKSPISDNNTSDGKTQNRRVEFVKI